MTGSCSVHEGAVHLEGLVRLLAVVDHGPHGLEHGDGTLGLEDVAAHVHARRALVDGLVGHLQGLQLGQLLAAGDHDRHRAGGGDLLEVGRRSSRS